MASLQRTGSQTATRATAGILSVLLHVLLLALIALSGGRRDGLPDVAMPSIEVTWLEAHDTGRPDGIEQGAWTPAMPESILGDQADLQSLEPPMMPLVEYDFPRTEAEQIPLVNADVEVAGETALIAAIDTPSTIVMPQVQAAALLQRVERVAEELAEAARARASWQQDGRRYDAELVLEPARNGVEPERAIVEVSSEHHGKQLRTRINLRRLHFSHFAQVIDRWDPDVQLHDDEIVGRVHINSRFNVLHDSKAAPRLVGKVTTAAAGFNVERLGRRTNNDVFPQGIETNTRRIPFSEQGWTFDRAQQHANVRVHELAGDTRIRFLADGSYWWRDANSGSSQYASRPGGQSVYFIASRGATVYLRGVVAGKFLVYSPDRIVVEGDTRYARDPHSDPDSDDFLGLVCDGDIEVAPPSVTGPGDLHIQAALFAKRRIVVTNAMHTRSATLHIFGSLAAGSLTESEPRYATKLEYDWRFEQLRPPGFPSLNRFAAEDWDGKWTEIPKGLMPSG